MASLILMAWLGFSLPAEVSAGTAEQAKAEAPAAKDTVELVKAFLQTPTEQLPPDFIPEFLGIDPETLPKKLQQPYLAKRLELYTLKQLVEGKKKGIVRMPDADCSIPKESKSDSAGVLKMAGYETITDDEERWVMDKTKCTERDLMCEFTLQVVNTKGKKPGSERRLLFLNPRDPIFALIGQYRAVGRQKQTNFFGIGSPTCAPHN